MIEEKRNQKKSKRKIKYTTCVYIIETFSWNKTLYDKELAIFYCLKETKNKTHTKGAWFSKLTLSRKTLLCNLCCSSWGFLAKNLRITATIFDNKIWAWETWTVVSIIFCRHSWKKREKKKGIGDGKECV